MANLPGLPIPGQSFGRFDEITDLVENASVLTLARRLGRRRVGIGLLAARCGFPLAFVVSGAVMLAMLTVAWCQGRVPTASKGLMLASP